MKKLDENQIDAFFYKVVYNHPDNIDGLHLSIKRMCWTPLWDKLSVAIFNKANKIRGDDEEAF